MSPSANDLKAALTQVFKVAVPDGVSGAYVTSLDLFFRKKSKSFGLELNIVELTDGQPDMAKVVSNSTVVVSSENINLSETSLTATNFKFPHPVFLSGGARYAFVLRALGGSPDYEIWTGISGRRDVHSGKSISSNPLSEQAYFAKSTADWAEIPNEDIKYKLYRAKFKVSEKSSVVLRKANTEILQLKNLRFSTGIPDIIAGDEVFGYANTGLRDANVYAKVIGFDTVNNLLYLKDSTGNFVSNATIYIVRSSVEGQTKPSSVGSDGLVTQLASTGVLLSSEISSILDYPTHAIVPKIGNKTNSLGSVSFEYRGAYKEGTPLVPVKESADSDWKQVINQEELDFYDRTRYMISKSNEKASLAGNSSVEIRGNLASDNDFISPVVDLRERSVVAIYNLIGANTSGEEGDYGAARTRYISKVITLADGQEAEDLKVYITAYKPPRTVVQVYAKVWNSEDASDFDSKVWTLMTQATESTLYSDPKNTDDYREYEFDMPNSAPVAGAAYSPLVDDPVFGDPVQYETSNGVYIGFKKYAIKVVLALQSDGDGFVYPRLSDVRAIALQK